MEPPLEESHALRLDAEDPLAELRGEFEIPVAPDGRPVRYFCGNSLGLLPRRARTEVERELEVWRSLAVDGHFRGDAPWTTVHRRLRSPLARIVGARDPEVAVLGGLTVNLHLLLVSFYRPSGARVKILVDEPCFPSDLYAVTTHLRHRGIEPETALVRVGPRPGEDRVREEDLEAAFERHGDAVALALFAGVNFLTGQRLDIERLTRAAHRVGAIAGFDLAHAAGNVELRLHEWDVDFAAWCSYKYLNAGPGAPGGVFIHERHASDPDLVRLGGWWGNDLERRFRMQLEETFEPVPEAEGWQISNPPILALAPLAGSLALFDRVGMAALRERSRRLTGYLESLLDAMAPKGVAVVTPRDPEARGAQLSLRVAAGSRAAQERLQARGVVCDFREPDIVRAAPAAFYTSHHDVWELANALAD